MRILVGTDQWFPDFRGGSARVATETARGLARRGHDVTVIAPRMPGQPERVEEGLLTILRAGRRGPFPKTVADTFDPIRHGAELRRQRFDVTLAHHATVATGLRLARVGSPHVFVFHASPVRELRFRRSRLPRGWERLTTYGLDPALVALERVAIRRARRVLVLSEFSRSLLRSDHPSVAKGAIRVPGGVDTDVFSPGDGPAAARERLGLSADRPVLVTVRRLADRMGLEELLQALKELGSEGPILALVGSGALESKLRRLSSSLGLDAQVRFVGQAGDDELPDWYRSASLFVLPTVAYEGFGMATVEALACGTPVVGTAVGATAELLTPLEPRLIAESAEPRVLAEAIGRGLTIADERLRERARAYAVERYSWDSVSEDWEAALQKALAS